jgi:hypothetical protein
MAHSLFFERQHAFQLDSGLGSGAVKAASFIGDSEFEASLAGTTGQIAESLIED